MTRTASGISLLMACLLLALAALALYPPPVGAQGSPLAEGERCPTVLRPDVAEVTCSCGKTEGGANMWGTDVYTDDSSICHAAVHAGVIPESGGSLRVRAVAGQSSYKGSVRNGMVTRDYGEWTRSIVFDDPGTLASSLGGLPLCPVLYDAAPQGWSGDCSCAAVRTGPVWGTNPYTSDSAVCRAARHAGVIGANGGVVHLSPAPGQESYGGSTRNGVTTDSYGPWSRSFRVSAP
jgi:hypothetical protein